MPEREPRLIERTRAELQADRDRLYAVLADCTDRWCCHHEQAWHELDATLFLLGEDQP